MAKIMVVEDDQSLREIYSIRLTAEGYEVVSAGDGEEALAVAVKERPDLIVSDVMMPKISGFDMLDILRSTPETKDVKVIMMTALSSDDQRKRGESLGADRYLVKSQVGIEDVINAVHDVLSGGGVAPVVPVATPETPAPAQTPTVPAAPSMTPSPVPAPNAPTPTAPAPAPTPVVPMSAPAPTPVAPVPPVPITPASAPVAVPGSPAPAPAPQVSTPAQSPVAPAPAPTTPAATPATPTPAPVAQPAQPATPAPVNPQTQVTPQNGQPAATPANPAQ